MLTLAPWESVVHADGSIETRPAEVTGDFVALDLRAPQEDVGFCLVASSMNQCPTSHEQLSNGSSCRDVRPSGLQTAKWTAACRGQAPAGDTLEDWIVSRFSRQADAAGTVHNRPALPDYQSGVLRFRLRGYSFAVSYELYHTRDARIIPALQMHQAEYATLRGDGSPEHVADARRTLKRFQERYGLTPQQTALIQGAHADDGPPLPHGTLIQHDFLTQGLTGFTSLAGSWSVDATDPDKGAYTTLGGNTFLRYDTELGADHYSQAVAGNSAQYPGVAVRLNIACVANADIPTPRTGYTLQSNASGFYLRRYTAQAAYTVLGSDTSGSPFLPSTYKLLASGSSLIGSVNGSQVVSVTDSTYSHTCAGCYHYAGAGRLNNFEAADPSGAGGDAPKQCYGVLCPR